jgi:hypothetical protein
MTNGGDITGGSVNAAVITGDSSLTITGITSALTNGMIFTIATVYDCHPETKAAYSHLKQFTVVSTTTGGASPTVIVVSPALYLTGARKNVAASDGTDLVGANINTQVLVFVGLGATSYVQGLMYQKDAFAFVTGELPLMADAIRCVRKTVDGFSMRVWQASDIRNDEQITRIDMLYGFTAIRPQWACRLIGSAN